MQLPSVHGRRRTVAALLCAAMIPLATGCSDGGGEEPEQSPPSSSGATADPVEPDYAMGVVTGRLSEKRQQRLMDRVRPTVESWVAAAYLGEYPRTDFAFPGFVDRAAKRAARHRSVASNAALGERLSSVELLDEHVRLDVLAGHNRAAGVTVRFRLLLGLEGDGIDQQDRVVGRLALTYTDHDWQVFGFTIRRRTL